MGASFRTLAPDHVPWARPGNCSSSYLSLEGGDLGEEFSLGAPLLCSARINQPREVISRMFMRPWAKCRAPGSFFFSFPVESGITPVL